MVQSSRGGARWGGLYKAWHLQVHTCRPSSHVPADWMFQLCVCVCVCWFFLIVYTHFLKACLTLLELYTQNNTNTMSKTPQFSCKMKLYIQNNVISSQNGILFSNDTQTIIWIDIYKTQQWCAQCKTLMENTSSFILMTQAFIHKCVVKYLRILFLYSEHTNTLFYFSHKDKVHSVDPSQHRAAHMLVNIQKEFTVHSYSKKTKQTVQRPLLCLSRATATHPHHEPCFTGQASA